MILSTIILPLCLLFKTAYSQEVPENVVHAFYKIFPDAKVLEWEFMDGEFLANFILEDKKCQKARFNPDGEWKETIIPLQFDDLPDPVIKKFEKKFEYVVSMSNISMQKTPRKDYFMLNFETIGQIWNLKLNKNGKILKKSAEDIDPDQEN